MKKETICVEKLSIDQFIYKIIDIINDNEK